MADDVAGPWDRLIDAADRWDDSSKEHPTEVDHLGDPVAWMLRRQAARSAMDYHRWVAQGVPRKIAITCVESDSDFMAADAAATALSALLR